MGSFGNCKVLSFESRRSKEIAELIRINGGQPFVAPALLEVPIEHNESAFQFADRLQAGDFQMVIFLTGVGARHLGKILSSRDGDERLPMELRQVKIVARGPKPTAVLREWQVPICIQVPEPNTYRELLTAVANEPGPSVAVQEYGRPNDELISGLEAQGRKVMSVPVYQWRLPEDTAPLSEALNRLLAGEFQIIVFTTGVQIEHFLGFAEQLGKRREAETALKKTFIASIGPTCSEALRQCGLSPSLEPSHPKMGILIREAAQQFSNVPPGPHSQLQQS